MSTLASLVRPFFGLLVNLVTGVYGWRATLFAVANILLQIFCLNSLGLSFLSILLGCVLILAAHFFSVLVSVMFHVGSAFSDERVSEKQVVLGGLVVTFFLSGMTTLLVFGLSTLSNPINIAAFASIVFGFLGDYIITKSVLRSAGGSNN